MPKITFIGAGSTFLPATYSAISSVSLSWPNPPSALHRYRPGTPATRPKKWLTGWRKSLGRTRKSKPPPTGAQALDGADYAICMFQIGGYKPGTVIDFEIPKKYGLRQTIADTLGIGGIMRGLRTIPVLLDICQDMEELCPDVTFLNYVNPMAMNCWAINRGSKIKTVGLCHSVQGTAMQLARDIDVPIRGDQLPLRRDQPHGLLPALRAQDGRRG